MGTTDSRKILSQIDTNFKSIRRYCDPYYGQITVLQQKSSKKQFALIQKSINQPTKQFQNYIQQRKTGQSCLLTIKNSYSCDIALCSDIKNFFFLVEYSTHTLYQEIIMREQRKQGFKINELLSIFMSYTDILLYMKELAQNQGKSMFRYLISNSFVIYDIKRCELKALESVFKNQPSGNQFNFHELNGFEEKREIYLSPQAYAFVCRRQQIKAKQTQYNEPSMVFTLALNFLECIVLADLTDVYIQESEGVNFIKINEIIEEVRKQYGDKLAYLLKRMVNQYPERRYSLQKVKEELVSQSRQMKNSFVIGLNKSMTMNRRNQNY